MNFKYLIIETLKPILGAFLAGIAVLAILIAISSPAHAKPGRSAYDVLGIPRTATLKEIKSAYRALVMKYHPDHNPGHEAEFREVNEAYNALTKVGKPAEAFDFATDRLATFDSDLLARRQRAEINAHGNPVAEFIRFVYLRGDNLVAMHLPLIPPAYDGEDPKETYESHLRIYKSHFAEVARTFGLVKNGLLSLRDFESAFLLNRIDKGLLTFLEILKEQSLHQKSHSLDYMQAIDEIIMQLPTACGLRLNSCILNFAKELRKKPELRQLLSAESSKLLITWLDKYMEELIEQGLRTESYWEAMGLRKFLNARVESLSRNVLSCMQVLTRHLGAKLSGN